MRAIKFRGYAISDGSLAFGDLVRINNVAYICSDEPDINIVAVKPEFVEQFSGLCDSEGTDIFEGDVLVRASEFTSFDAAHYVVIFDQDEGGWIIEPDDRFSYSDALNSDNADKFVVVGHYRR